MAQVLSKQKPKYHGMKVTREIYLDLEDDGYKYDMIDGVLYMSPSAFFEHNRIIFRICGFLNDYFKKNQIAEAVPETDVFLPDRGDVLRPDISVILKENYDIIKGHIHGVPDIVFEVLSSSTRTRDLGIKADRYLKNGVKEYFIIDPENKTISLWQNNNKIDWQKLENNRASYILPDFKLIEPEIFS